jgi:hypothetical protein
VGVLAQEVPLLEEGEGMDRDMYCCGGCGDQFWEDEGEVVKRDTLIEFTCHRCKPVLD